MGAREAGLDFSKEDFDTAAQICDGVWVVSEKHNPGLNEAMELNNRCFVFRLREGDTDVLLVFGFGGASIVSSVKKLEASTGLAVKWVVGNGGAHHMFLELWYQGFPDARVLVPAKRIPFTRNGIRLQEEYADRWELLHGPKPEQLLEVFGDQIDVVIFDQLFSYPDQAAAELGAAADHRDPKQNVGGFGLMKTFGALVKNTSQPSDEVTFFHRASGLVVAGHNFPFIYVPKGYKPPAKHKMKAGGFPLNLMMKLMMPKGTFKSSLEGQPAPIADPAIHASEWDMVLEWDVNAWSTAHDPPGVSGPECSGDEIKKMVRESIHRSGEDDPSGKRLKWNIKHGK